MKVNGEAITLCNKIMLEDWLKENGYCLERIAVEIDGEIVSRAEYGCYKLSENNTIEIVSFVGGG